MKQAMMFKASAIVLSVLLLGMGVSIAGAGPKVNGPCQVTVDRVTEPNVASGGGVIVKIFPKNDKGFNDPPVLKCKLESGDEVDAYSYKAEDGSWQSVGADYYIPTNPTP